MALQIKQLYSESSGNRPTKEQVDVGQLWVNIGDSTIGTKKSDGTVVAYAQLTESERELVRNATPKTGQIEGVTSSQVAAPTSADAVTIDDNSCVVLEGTLTANEFHVTINKTTAHKNTKLVLKKPAGITTRVTWTGVDLWLIGDTPPTFGDTEEEQELAVAIFTSPTKVAANVIYNTEHPIEFDGGISNWGQIKGTLSDQVDLQQALDSKANTEDLSNYVEAQSSKNKNIISEAGASASALFLNGEEGTTDLYASGSYSKAHIYISGSNDAKESVALIKACLVSNEADYTQFRCVPSEIALQYVEGEDLISEVSVSKENGITFQDKNTGQVQLSGIALKSELTNYAPLTGAAFTGQITIDEKPVATTDQIPDVSQFLTQTNAASTYATKTELTDGLAQKADSSDLNSLMPKSGGAFTGAITIKEPTEGSNPATKNYVDNAISSVYKYKGSVATESALPSSDQSVGDVYNVEDTGDNYAWDGTKWDKLAGTVDLSDYVTKTTANATYLGKTAKATSATLADKATILANSRTIALSGAVTGTATSFDGSKNISIATTSVDGSKVSVFGAASADSAGTIGAVPAPGAGAQSKYLRADGTWQTPPNTTYSNMTGATSSAAGKAGLVPAPSSGYNTRFLRGDGTWQTPTDNKVSCTASTATGEYPILLKASTSTSTATAGALFVTSFTVNPSTGMVTAKGFTGPITGNASTATKLATARSIRTNLASTSAVNFDGSGNVTPGITGTLGTANGGTGRTDGKALNVTQVVTLSAVGPLGYTSTNAQYLTTSAAIAYWNGRYSGSSSNLQYCKTGTIIGSNGGTVTGSLTVNGTLSGGTLNATSDYRLKDIVNTASDFDLSSLIPYRYTFKNDEKKEVHVGLIAQEVQQVVPEAVKVIDEDGHLGIEYNALVAILIDKVNLLEKRIAQLESSLQCKATF